MPGRIDKVNEFIKREISNIVLFELQDPRLKIVTITGVEMSRDLRYAKTSFSVLGTKKQIAEATEGLSSARGMIRKLIGQRINMRNTPEIQFVYDRSLEYSSRIEETLQEIQEIKNESQTDSEDDS